MMKKGLVVFGLVLFVGLAVWWALFITKPLPKDGVYAPQKGEVVSATTVDKKIEAAVAEPRFRTPQVTTTEPLTPARQERESQLTPVEETGKVIVKGRL